MSRRWSKLANAKARRSCCCPLTWWQPSSIQMPPPMRRSVTGWSNCCSSNRSRAKSITRYSADTGTSCRSAISAANCWTCYRNSLDLLCVFFEKLLKRFEGLVRVNGFLQRLYLGVSAVLKVRMDLSQLIDHRNQLADLLVEQQADLEVELHPLFYHPILPVLRNQDHSGLEQRAQGEQDCQPCERRRIEVPQAKCSQSQGNY